MNRVFKRRKIALRGKSLAFCVSICAALSSFIWIAGQAPALAQVSLVNTLLDTAQIEYNKGSYQSALSVSERALETAKELKGQPFLQAKALLNVASTLTALGRYKEAEEHYKSLMALLEANKLIYTEAGLLAFNNYASQAQSLGRYTEASALLSKAVSIGDSSFGPLSMQNVLSINNLAALYLGWGKQDEAVPLIERAAKIAKTPKGKKSIALPYALCNAAKLAELRGNYKQSEELCQQALTATKAIFGEKHPYVALVYKNGLAQTAVKNQDYETAEKYLAFALEIDQKANGTESLTYADTLVTLADIESKAGKYTKAMEHLEKAKAIYKAVLAGNDTINSIAADVTEGSIESRLGNYDSAIEKLNSSLLKAKAILGNSHIFVAKLYKEIAEAESFHNPKLATERIEEALNSARNSVAKTNPDFIDIERTAGRIYRLAGMNDKARTYLEDALANAQVCFSAESLASLSIQRELANLEEDLGENQKACERLKSVISQIEKNHGAESPLLIADLQDLAELQKRLNQGDEARANINRAATLLEKMPGASEQTAVKLDLKAGSNKPITDKWALVVGISNFRDSSINLKYAAKDATDFANFLTQKAGFKKDHVKLLLNDNATRDGIIRNMGENWLGRLANPDDLVVVYVSSHGSPSNDAADGVNFLVAHDTNKDSLVSTGIPMQWLSKMVKEQVHSNRVVLILDVCHSAAASGAKGLIKQPANTPETLKIGEGQLVICSSSKDQVSWESKNYPNSVFTRKLIEALSEAPRPVTEAFEQMKDDVQKEVLRDRASLQTPILWSKQWLGSPPVLSVQPVAPRQGL